MNNDIAVELFTWMKEVTAVNTGKKYYMIGKLKDVADTLLITEKGSNGGAVMFCITHSNAYPIHGKCETCRNSLREDTNGVGATACSTHENKQN